MTVPTEQHRPIEDHLEAALRDTAMRNVPDDAAPPGIREAEVVPISSRRGWRVAAAGLAAAAVAGIAFGVAGATGGTDRATLPATGPTPKPVLTEQPTSVHTGANDRVVVGEFCDNFVPSGCSDHRNAPLWPFSSYTEVQAWRAQRRNETRSAWQYDARQVGDRYLHRVLGLRGLSVLSYPGYPIHGREPAAVMAVDVGYRENGTPHASGDLLLARYGEGADYPWEVVGPVRSRTPAFAITAPAVTVNAADPVQVSGRGAPAGATVHVTAITATGTVAGRDTGIADSSGHWSAPLDWNAAPGIFAVVATSGGTPARPAHFDLLGLRAG
ncbi:MAG TPA: hypothetical protein VFH38_10855 [Jatrophihabitans sp.]|nr:hypothetical protein [Jatrophihabitans sp.]